jgi:hypothetical protein
MFDLFLHLLAGMVIFSGSYAWLSAWPHIARMIFAILITSALGLEKELLDIACSYIAFGLDWLGNFSIWDLSAWALGMTAGIIAIYIYHYEVNRHGSLDR